MYQGATLKREYPVTMVRVAGVEEKTGDEAEKGGDDELGSAHCPRIDCWLYSARGS